MKNITMDEEVLLPAVLGTRTEKGSHEWNAFNIVDGDIVDTYRVHVPTRPIVIAQEHHVLRITYPPRYINIKGIA